MNTNIYNDIIQKIAEYYDLNLTSFIPNTNWYQCNKNKNLYLINHIIDNVSQSNNILGKADYIQINFVLDNMMLKNIYTETKLSKKRLLHLDNNTSNMKKLKSYHINWNDMVSASSIRNYMNDDPCIDYYKEYNIVSIDSIPTKGIKIKLENNIHTKYILENGNKFEESVIEMIKKNHNVIQVGTHYDARNEDKYKETINIMKEGVNIIYQGVLHNYNDNTYGLPDLLVRSDYINKLMGYDIIAEDEMKIGSPKLNVPWHYKVIDIKCSTIPLKNDLVSNTNMMAYKGQVYIYTEALNKILGTTMNTGFILGKRYEIEKQEIIVNNMNKLGLILFDCELIMKVKKACNWIRDVRNDGIKWTLNPIPSRNELYPNMKNNKDDPYTNIKKQFAVLYNEITSIWNCSYEARQIAHSKGITSYKDIKLCAETMGFSDTKTSQTINKILDINRQTKNVISNILPSNIYERENWMNNNSNILDSFLDYETIITESGEQYIFMIGIGYEENKKWVYKNFIMEELTNINELAMFNKFDEYINTILNKNNKEYIKFFHWSYAELTFYSKFKNKNPLEKFNKNYTFYDLNKVFIMEPIVIKDCLSFSLKSVAKALHRYKLIESIWPEGECSNGLNAMILALNYYNNINTNNINTNNINTNNINTNNINTNNINTNNINTNNININPHIMNEIILYNEIDCKTMWEILHLIRKN